MYHKNSQKTCYFFPSRIKKEKRPCASGVFFQSVIKPQTVKAAAVLFFGSDISHCSGNARHLLHSKAAVLFGESGQMNRIVFMRFAFFSAALQYVLSFLLSWHLRHAFFLAYLSSLPRQAFFPAYLSSVIFRWLFQPSHLNSGALLFFRGGSMKKTEKPDELRTEGSLHGVQFDGSQACLHEIGCIIKITYIPEVKHEYSQSYS